MDELWKHRPVAAGAYLDSKSDLQWDDISISVIPLEDRLDEISLYDKKWWDYRDMHPAKATALFAHYYGEFYCESYERRYGEKTQDVFQTPLWDWSAEVPVRAKAFWKARRHVDEAGMPYEFFMGMFFSIAEDYFENLPRPQELWRYDVFNPVMSVWAGLGESGHIRLPKDDLFKVRYNKSHSRSQRQWLEWLEKKLKDRPKSVLREFEQFNSEYITDDLFRRLLAG
jgi:hypothetical protein